MCEAVGGGSEAAFNKLTSVDTFRIGEQMRITGGGAGKFSNPYFSCVYFVRSLSGMRPIRKKVTPL